jgi:Cu-Zn family superoxide dismutase
MKRNIATDILLISVVSIGCFFASPFLYYRSPLHSAVTNARAVIHPTKNNTVTGVVTLTQETNGVRIVADLSNLTPGKHGFHIHEFGDCACDDAMCAGGHYNPHNMPHGGPHDAQRHIGDLGNIEADVQGNVHLDYMDSMSTLNGPYSLIGRTIIIHEKADDFVTQPTGDAGARLGCGVIGMAKPN